MEIAEDLRYFVCANRICTVITIVVSGGGGGVEVITVGRRRLATARKVRHVPYDSLAGSTFSFRKLVVLVELAVNLGRDVLCNVPSAILGYVEGETSGRTTLYNAVGLVGDPGMPGPGYMVQDVDKIF